jgi:hypothetical protein
MKLRTYLSIIAACCALAAWGCGKSEPAATNNPSTASQPAAPGGDVPAALPDNAFKAVIAIAEPPAKLRSGQKQTIQVKVKNASDVLWYARGAVANTAPSNKFYLAVGNRWLAAADDKLVSDMDGRYGVDHDLKPGEETTVPLTITAPKTPGEYTLEVDLVQEQVAWFHDKGSASARVKIKVE